MRHMKLLKIQKSCSCKNVFASGNVKVSHLKLLIIECVLRIDMRVELKKNNGRKGFTILIKICVQSRWIILNA